MSRKWTLLTGLPAFLALIVLSVLYYKERTVMLDVSYHLFNILKDGGFAIQINRFGAAMTQALPLLGMKAGFSLGSIALLYSVSFVLFYLACFLVILLGLRNTKVALCLLLFHTMMVTHSFYWIQCEFIQGVSFSFVYIAMIENELRREKTAALFHALSPVFLVTIVFFYPLLLFVLLFALAYFHIHYREKHALLRATALSYLALFGIKVVFFKTGYDAQAMSGVNNIITLFPKYIMIQANKNFIRYCLHDYYMVIIFFLAAVVFYLRAGLYRKLLLLCIFFSGLLFLINVSYFHGAEQFYLEPQYRILSVFVAFSLVYDVFPAVRERTAVIAVAATVVLAFVRILQVQPVYSGRVDWFRSYLHATEWEKDKKIIVRQQEVPMDRIKMSWGSSYECWLLSTMEQGSSRSVIIEETPGEFDWAMGNNRSFLTKWGAFDYHSLNKKYFRFTDTGYYIKR